VSAVMRTVERLMGKDWHVCQMSELNKGDIFRLREPTGELVGEQNWIAASEPQITVENDKPIWGIVAKGEDDD